MTTSSDIQKLFRQIVISSAPLPGTNENIILSEQNAPKPVGLFVRINILSVKDLSAKHEQKILPDGRIQVNFLQRAYLSLNAFGVGAPTYVENLCKKLKLPSTNEKFRSHKIALRNMSDVKTIPIFENERWVERGQTDIQIDFIDSIIDDLGYFDKVHLTGELTALLETSL